MKHYKYKYLKNNHKIALGIPFIGSAVDSPEGRKCKAGRQKQGKHADQDSFTFHEANPLFQYLLLYRKKGVTTMGVY